MRMKKYACLLLCLIIAIMPIISSAEGENEQGTQEVVQEQSTENSNEVVQEDPVVEETPEVKEDTSNEQLNNEEPQSEEVTEEKPKEENNKEEKPENKEAEQPAEEPTEESVEKPVEEKKVEEPKIENSTVTVNVSSNNGSTSAYRYDEARYNPEVGTKLRYPVAIKAALTSGYGARTPFMTPMGMSSSNHGGIDLAAPLGTPIVAAESGEVTMAYWYGGYGNMVEITHPDGMKTRYGHLSEINVKVGDKVLRGQLIAKMGSTGISTGSHLHFEVYPTGTITVNPLPFLEEPAIDTVTEYSNVKFLFVDKSKTDEIADGLTEYYEKELENLQIKQEKEELLEDELLSKLEKVEIENNFEVEDNLAIDYNNILFQLNERLPIEIKNEKTIIDISKYYNSGLISEEPLLIQTIEGYNISFEIKQEIEASDELETSVLKEDGETKYLLVIDKEVTQSEIQLIIPSNPITKTKVATYIESDFDTIESNIYEFNPLFGMSLDLDIKDITKENITVKVDDKKLSHNYYSYEDDTLHIQYSPINVELLEINISKEAKELEELPEVEPIHNITTWLNSTEDLDVISLNSTIECYITSSTLRNNIDTDYNSLPYSRYNYERDEENNVVSNILIDEELGDAFIGIPVEQLISEIKFTSDLDPMSYMENLTYTQEVEIDNVKYNTFLYGEQLNILDNINIQEGLAEVDFEILDYYKDKETSYFIISYRMKGIGGYFGVQINTENQDN